MTSPISEQYSFEVYVEATVLERWSSIKLALFYGWYNKLCCHVADTKVGGIHLYFLLHIKEWTMGGMKEINPEKLLPASTQAAAFDKDSTKIKEAVSAPKWHVFLAKSMCKKVLFPGASQRRNHADPLNTLWFCPWRALPSLPPGT